MHRGSADPGSWLGPPGAGAWKDQNYLKLPSWRNRKAPPLPWPTDGLASRALAVCPPQAGSPISGRAQGFKKKACGVVVALWIAGNAGTLESWNAGRWC